MYSEQKELASTTTVGSNMSQTMDDEDGAAAVVVVTIGSVLVTSVVGESFEDVVGGVGVDETEAEAEPEHPGPVIVLVTKEVTVKVIGTVLRTAAKLVHRQ